MKAFITACVVLTLTLTLTVINDVYYTSVCKEIESTMKSDGYEGATEALKTFKRHEFLLNLSVDNGYVNEAKVSIESLVSAYECDDKYEISRYIKDSSIRMERIRRSLIL